MHSLHKLKMGQANEGHVSGRQANEGQVSETRRTQEERSNWGSDERNQHVFDV
jgi:hypothetical protein